MASLLTNYIAQVERYGKNENIGETFMGGFNLKSGAIASSAGHDNHNIIVMGLFSGLDAWELADEKKKLNEKVHELGCTIDIMLMFLSFICLVAIPEYAITDHNFIGVMRQKIIDLVLVVVK